jgi:uncharacterized protein involved in exopolysaccharide biosynthesis
VLRMLRPVTAPDANSTGKGTMEPEARELGSTEVGPREQPARESGISSRHYDLQITPRDLLSPLFRRWRVLVGTFFCVFMIVAGTGFLRWHRYQSHTTISIRSLRMAPTLEAGGKNQTYTTSVDKEELQSLADLFKSRDLLEKVVIANNLQPVRGSFLHPHPTESDAIAGAVRTLARKITISIFPESNLVEVSYSSSDPALTYNVLNSLSSFYIAMHGEGPQQTSKAEGSMLDRPALQDPAKAEQRDYLRYLSQQQQLPTLPRATIEVSVVVPPAIPVLPAYSTGSIFLLAFILALVSASLAGYLMSCFDPFFHSPEDVAAVLGIPVVEAVPKKAV